MSLQRCTRRSSGAHINCVSCTPLFLLRRQFDDSAQSQGGDGADQPRAAYFSWIKHIYRCSHWSFSVSKSRIRPPPRCVLLAVALLSLCVLVLCIAVVPISATGQCDRAASPCCVVLAVLSASPAQLSSHRSRSAGPSRAMLCYGQRRSRCPSSAGQPTERRGERALGSIEARQTSNPQPRPPRWRSGFSSQASRRWPALFDRQRTQMQAPAQLPLRRPLCAPDRAERT